MNYLIVGTGGIGGCLGAYMAAAGTDVSFIARGQHLQTMQESGITVRLLDGSLLNTGKLHAFTDAQVKDTYDVILVCVKGYSLHSIVPAIQKASHEKTVIIPILNALNAGERLRSQLPNLCVLGGCVYLSAYVESPGTVVRGSDLMKVVYGIEEGPAPEDKWLAQIRIDFAKSGIEGVLSENIRRDIFKKFSFTSAFVGVAAYEDINAGILRDNPVYLHRLQLLLEELGRLAKAMNIDLGRDYSRENMNILHSLSPNTTASLQKDLKAGKPTELEELIFHVDRLATALQVEAPEYHRVAERFRLLQNS